MWIKYSEQKPEEGKDLWYFFDIVGVHKGQYYGCGEFAGDKGFLRYDVTHWQYDVGQGRPERPLPEEFRVTSERTRNRPYNQEKHND